MTRPGSFYDGTTPDRTLRPCPRCRLPSDPVIGHGDTPGCLRREKANLAARAEASGTRRRRKKGTG